MTSRKQQKEQEILEEAPSGSSKLKFTRFSNSRSNSNVNDSNNSPEGLEKQSTFSRLSKGVSGVFTYSMSTNDNQNNYNSFSANANNNNNNTSSSYSLQSPTSQQRLNKTNSSRNFNKTSPLKIEELFESHFTKSKDEILQLIEPSRSSLSKNRRSPEPLTIEDLKSLLKNILEEIETLKYKCIVVENRYKEATITASRELQESMNILFKLQQKTASLEDSSKAVEKLTHDLKVVKVRLAEKDKECRWLTSENQRKDTLIQDQANEIKELAALVGGNSIDLAKQAEEARRANLLSEEVKDLTQKLKQLKTENTVLHTRVDELGNNNNLNNNNGTPNTIDSDIGKSTFSDKERDELLSRLHSKEEDILKYEQEIVKLRGALSTVQSTGDVNAVVLVEREMRLEAERKAEKERSDRLSAEAEWNLLSEQVEEEMDNSRRQYEALLASKTELEKELEVYRLSRSSTTAAASQTQLLEIENKWIESKYELRKSQMSLIELKGDSTYHIRVIFSVKGAATSKSNVKGPDSPFIRLPSDNVSIRVTETLFRGATAGVLDSSTTDNSKKYICDRVYNRSDPDQNLQLANSLDEYIQYAIEGHQSSVISFGKTCTDRSQLTFGSSEDITSGLVYRSLHLFVGRLQSMETDGWTFTLHTSFIRIYEEEIQDMFSNNPTDSANHEVQKNTDGSISITNVNMLTTNWRDKDYLTSISNRICQVYSQNINSDDGSRLHFVLTFHISGTHLTKESVIEGQYSLVHIGGAENLTKSRSMQCFSELFPAISKRQSHIPYRNSKLTYLLQPSLSIGGRCIMIFALDGTDSQSYDTTVTTLQLATQAFECTIIPPAATTTTSNRLPKGGDRKSNRIPKMKLNLL